MDGPEATFGPAAGETFDLNRAEVRISLKCVECGYDLRGLRAGGKCPECGHAVLDTVQRTVHEPRHTPSHRFEANAAFITSLLMFIGVLLSYLSIAIFVLRIDESTIMLSAVLGWWPPTIAWCGGFISAIMLIRGRSTQNRSRFIRMAALTALGLVLMVAFHSIVYLAVIDLLGASLPWPSSVTEVRFLGWSVGLALCVSGLTSVLSELQVSAGDAASTGRSWQGSGPNR